MNAVRATGVVSIPQSQKITSNTSKQYTSSFNSFFVGQFCPHWIRNRSGYADPDPASQNQSGSKSTILEKMEEKSLYHNCCVLPSLRREQLCCGTHDPTTSCSREESKGTACITGQSRAPPAEATCSRECADNYL